MLAHAFPHKHIHLVGDAAYHGRRVLVRDPETVTGHDLALFTTDRVLEPFFGAPVFAVAGVLSMTIVVLVILTETMPDVLAVGEIVKTRVDRRRIGNGLRADMGASLVSPISTDSSGRCDAAQPVLQPHPVRAPEAGILGVYLRSPLLRGRPGCVGFVAHPLIQLVNAILRSPRFGWVQSTADNALNLLEERLSHSKRLYVFGRPYTNGLGVHDIHMSQGDPPGPFQGQDGICRTAEPSSSRTTGRSTRF